MLIVVTGGEYDAVKAFVDEATKESSVEYIENDSFDESKILQKIATSGLFANIETFVFSRPSVDILVWEFLLKHAKNMQTSPNTFIVLENKILKKDLGVFEESGAAIKALTTPEKKKDNGFNIFSLNDAFGEKDKKKLWLSYQNALRSGISAEEVHSVLWWQMKNMRLIALENKNPGVHPFVFQKAQEANRRYSQKELLAQMKKMVQMFHQVRRGRAELAHELEKFVLAL